MNIVDSGRRGFVYMGMNERFGQGVNKLFQRLTVTSTAQILPSES